jgi:hypothetical protein
MMRCGSMRRGVAVLTLASFLTACYTERPVTAPAPAPTSRIIAQVTDTGAVAMANTIGIAAVEVEGVVAQADANVWKLHLVRVGQRGGTSTRWKREVVTFPRYALTNAREKTLDKRRSWIVAGVLAAAIVAGTLLFGSVITGGAGNGEPVPPV